MLAQARGQRETQAHHARTHTHTRPERHHKKGSGGIQMAEGLAQKTLLSGPCSLSRANPRKHPNPSPGHVPVVSCTGDLPLLERERERETVL